MTAINSNRAIRGPITAVPVVAGKGVRLVADNENNRWVVEADETVLWSGDTGQIVSNTDGSLSLSESASNFEKIRFIVYGSASTKGLTCIDVVVNDADDPFYPIAVSYTNDGSAMFTDTCVVRIRGTSVIVKTGFRASITSTGVTSGQNNRGPGIVKVIGVNRIASN